MSLNPPTDEIIIRALAPEDLPDFVDLWDEAFFSDPYAFRTSSKNWKQKPKLEVKKSFYASIRKQNFILGAFCGTQLIGMVGIYHHKGNFTLWGTFVRQAYRGKKVGYNLITQAIEKLVCGQIKAQNLYLEVFSAARAARSMYAKIGFREVESKTTGEILAVKNLR